MGGYAILASLPASVNFGSINVSLSSATIPITLVNNGNEDSIVGNTVIFGSNPDQFQIGGSSLGGLTIPKHVPGDPGANTLSGLTVTFNPTSVGAKNAVLYVYSSNAVNSPLVIPLTGYGDTSTAGVSVTPSTFDFGSIIPTGAPVSQLFTLKNTGVSDLVISSLPSVVSPFYLSGFPSLPCTIHPGNTITFTITFAAKGIISTLIINNGGPGGGSSYAVDDLFNIAGITGSEGKVDTESSGTVTGIEVTNPGYGGSNGTAVATTAVSPSTGAGLTVDVVVFNLPSGSQAQNVLIVSNAPSSPFVLALTATVIPTVPVNILTGVLNYIIAGAIEADGSGNLFAFDPSTPGCENALMIKFFRHDWGFPGKNKTLNQLFLLYLNLGPVVVNYTVEGDRTTSSGVITIGSASADGKVKRILLPVNPTISGELIGITLSVAAEAGQVSIIGYQPIFTVGGDAFENVS